MKTKPNAIRATRAAARFVLCGALAALGSAGARAGYNVWTGDYTFSRQELQEAIAKRLGYRLVEHRLELYAVPIED